MIAAIYIKVHKHGKKIRLSVVCVSADKLQLHIFCQNRASTPPYPIIIK